MAALRPLATLGKGVCANGSNPTNPARRVPLFKKRPRPRLSTNWIERAYLCLAPSLLSALLPPLAIAASISDFDFLKCLHHCRASSFLERSTQFRALVSQEPPVADT